MNPLAIMKIKQSMTTFTANHPKFVMFLKNVFSNEIEPGTVIEISVQRPGMEKVTTNMKVQQSDLDLVEGLKGMKI